MDDAIEQDAAVGRLDIDFNQKLVLRTALAVQRFVKEARLNESFEELSFESMVRLFGQPGADL